MSCDFFLRKISARFYLMKREERRGEEERRRASGGRARERQGTDL
jgi:hypothetical protein